MCGSNNKFRSLVAAAALAGVAVAAVATAAEGLPEITVQGSRLSKSTVPSRQPGLPPVQTVNLSRTIAYSDLDISTGGGARELEQRIAATVRALCDELDKLSPIRDGYCVRDTINSAEKQADLAIKAAERARLAGN